MTKKIVQPKATFVRLVCRRLKKYFPAATCALHYRSAEELLVAVILSAQCTDERVNKTTPELFRRFPSPKDLAAAASREVEQLVHPCGFFRMKTKSIQGACRMLLERFEGKVPSSMAELLLLPGVARKSANVVLGTWFGIAEGVVVDTHVTRIARRLGLTQEETPEKIERDLMALLPRKEWTDFSHRLVHFGRAICQARKPDCAGCFLKDCCPWEGRLAFQAKRER